MDDREAIIAKLEEEILLTEQKNSVKKLMLRHLRQAEKRKLFSNKVVKYYFNTIAILTKPLAVLHDKALSISKDPVRFRMNELVEEAKTLCKRTACAESNNSKKTNRLAVQCAKMVIKLDPFNLEPDVSTVLSKLRAEVQRLRPEKYPLTTLVQHVLQQKELNLVD